MTPESSPSRDVAPQPVAFTAQNEAHLREAQLELLAEFDRLCSRNGLDYFALYGTALGAVRHEGFIPWDDDLDVGMVRSDYDQLMRVVGSEPGGEYFLQTVDSDPHYGCLFGKLRKNGTRCVDRISHGSEQHGGIFIDVFPLDSKATKRWARFEQKVMRYVGFRLLYLKAGYHLPMRSSSLLSRLALVAARTIVRVTPRSLIIAGAMRHTRLARTDSPDQYVSLFGAYVYDRDTIDADWVHPLTRVPFEGMSIPVFSDVDAYLAQIYGDYMQPPPLDQQVGHHDIVEFDFGTTGR